MDWLENEIDSVLHESLSSECFISERRGDFPVFDLEAGEDTKTKRPKYEYVINIPKFSKTNVYKQMLSRWNSKTKGTPEQFNQHLRELVQFLGPFMGQKLFSEEGEIEKLAQSNFLITNKDKVISAFNKLPSDNGAKQIILYALPDNRKKLINRINYIINPTQKFISRRQVKDKQLPILRPTGAVTKTDDPGTGITTTGGGTGTGITTTGDGPGTAITRGKKGETTRGKKGETTRGKKGETTKAGGKQLPDKAGDKQLPVKAKDKQLPATIKKPEEKPEIKVDPDLQVGGSGVRIIGGLKSVGDAADTIIFNKIKDDPVIKATGVKGDQVKRFAEVVKQFALQTISGEDLTRQLEEQEPSPAEERATQQKIQAQLKKVVANFNKFLDDKVRPVMDNAVAKKNKPGETRELKDILIDDLEDFLNALKNETKRKVKANSALVTKNYGAYQKMAPALSVAMVRFLSDYMGTAASTNEQITTKEVKAMSDNEATLNEDNLVEIVINFEDLRSKQMNESFLAMFGGWVEHILKAMFGGLNIPVKVQGNDREVQAFAAALGREKRYIETAKRYGLDHPTTYKNKAKLAGAAKNFQRETGLKWPFK